MTTQISHFYFQHSSVRVQIINNEPWFCLKDVCEILTVDRTSRLLRDLDEKGLADCHTLTIGGKQRLSFINEPNLYRVIFRSNKPEARQFQDWVFNEVLPTIRKTGRYEHPVSQPAWHTREPLNQEDLQNLKWLIDYMVDTLRFQGVWSRAIWLALRRVTGVPSPEKLSVEDLPALTRECRRIIEIIGLVNEKVARFEREAARRILRNNEDCQQVLRQLESELDNCGLEYGGIRNLERHEKMALARLERRLYLP
ncbi:phage antirepressor protein [Salmonella enterica]|nr:phage antirepressor protein [Salmonella enterica]